MRALFVTTALARGGAERQWRTLLPALRARGVDVALLTLKDRGAFYEELEALGVPVRCASLRSRFDAAGLRRALRVGDRPDVVVAQGVDAIAVAAALSLRTRARVVAVEHGGVELGRRRHRRLVIAAASRRVDRLVVVSPSQLPALRALGYGGTAAVVIPNGVDPVMPGRSRADVRREMGIPEDAFVAVFVGGLRPPKRPAAFAAAVAAGTGHGLVAGDGPLRAAVDGAAARARGRVHVLGERHDVPDLLGASDAACLVSDTEGLPMAVLEAMSAGLPVVASAVGGVPDAVVDGETGILVAPGDDAALAAALAALAADPARAAALGAAGRRRFEERFSTEHMADAYAALLAEAVA